MYAVMSAETIRFIVFLVAFVCNLKESRCNPANESSELLIPRIVGGDFAREGDYPWAVAILRRRVYHCTFSLISVQTTIGAAHCIFGIRVNEFEGRIGNIYINRAKPISFAHAIPHQYYNPEIKSNDIGLLISESSLEITSRVKPISLPLAHHAYVGTADVIGWGSSSKNTKAKSDRLKAVTLDIMDELSCLLTYGEWDEPVDTICAGTTGKGPCWGDSGAGLVYTHNNKKVLIGVYSGYYVGCATNGEPNYFSSTGYYAYWIRENAFGDVNYIE